MNILGRNTIYIFSISKNRVLVSVVNKLDLYALINNVRNMLSFVKTAKSNNINVKQYLIIKIALR
jgi:hypothetical protein